MRRNDKAVTFAGVAKILPLGVAKILPLGLPALILVFSAAMVSKRGERGFDRDDFFAYEPRPGIQVPQGRRPPD